MREPTRTTPGINFCFDKCYGTDFVTTASAFFFFYFGVKLQHSAVNFLYSAVAGS